MSGASTCTATWSKVSIMATSRSEMIIAVPPAREPVAQRHRRAAHTGQEIVGEDLAGFRLGLRLPAHLLLAEDDRGQRRNVTGL